MERLNFDQGSRYDGLEAAIHIARYSFARPYCANKRVLDIACGEGYGSHLLARWGAAEVVGVDVSPEALQSANAHFSGEHVRFVQSEGESLLDKFEPESFDLIVSFETIEHVSDPVKFLNNLKRLVKSGGFIAISCPNDWWYFPTEEEKNPFHLRKYHFDEFKSQTEGVLGEARGWFLGGPATGFLNVGYGRYPSDEAGRGQLQMLNTVPITAGFMVPADRDAGPQPANASYFLGLWGDGDPAEEGVSAGAAILPLSMDSFRTGIFRGHMPSVKEALAAEEAKHQSEKAGLENELRAAELRVEALGLELQLTREQLGERVHRLTLLEQNHSELEQSHAALVQQHLALERHNGERIDWEHKLRAASLRVEALGLELQLTREQLGDRVHRLAVSEHANVTFEQNYAALQQECATVRQEYATTQQSYATLEQANATLEQANVALTQRNSELEWAAARYIRVSSAIPAWLRKITIFLYRHLWKSGRGN